jgi:hypothetical protein
MPLRDNSHPAGILEIAEEQAAGRKAGYRWRFVRKTVEVAATRIHVVWCATRLVPPRQVLCFLSCKKYNLAAKITRNLVLVRSRFFHSTSNVPST